MSNRQIARRKAVFCSQVSTAKIVRQARTEAGLTMAELAERLGLKDETSIRDYEKKETKLWRLSKILRAMGYDLEIRVTKRG